MSTYCADQIVLLAGNIYSGLDSPSSTSIGLISGWVASSGALGDVNNRLSTSFYLSGASTCIAGGFGDEEAHIMSLIYEVNYYYGRVRNQLANGGTFVVSIGDGDSRFTRESAVKVAREYRELGRDVDEGLKIAVGRWKMNHAMPVDVRFGAMNAYPSP